MSVVETRLAQVGFALPSPNRPIAKYVLAVRTGNLVFLSGQTARTSQGAIRGRVGQDLTEEAGHEAASLAALSLLSALKDEIGDLDRVARVVKVFGMVNCTDDFERQPEIIDGASEVLIAAFGDERGRHARSAVGMRSLPRGIAVEIELIVEVVP
jgi:enamine deaminase RidA (YjgF/YER057c/UK114 family)